MRDGKWEMGMIDGSLDTAGRGTGCDTPLRTSVTQQTRFRPEWVFPQEEQRRQEEAQAAPSLVPWLEERQPLLIRPVELLTNFKGAAIMPPMR